MARKRTLPKPKTDPTLSLEQFAHLEDGPHSLPQLALSMVVPESAFRDGGVYRPLQFKGSREWLKVAHAGYRITTLLTLRNGVLRSAVAQLADQWREHDCRSLDALILYRQQLRQLLAADCNDCYRSLSPGYYPIDVGYVSFLASDRLPDQLDELIDWRSGLERASGGGKWQLGILGETRSEWA